MRYVEKWRMIENSNTYKSSNAIKNLTLSSGNKHVECGIYISYLN